MDIEDIAEEHSVQDLGRVSPAYECGFTQGANYMHKQIDDFLKGHTFRNVKGEWISGSFIAEELQKHLEQ